MTTQKSCAGAPSHITVTWHSIDCAQCHREVRRLQTRIVKATQEGRWGKVKALQRLLTHSFSGKALAVRRVTENQGKKTPGVDKITWSNPEAKGNAVQSLRRHAYKPLPLRRLMIPKTNGKLRPLGIPTMKDRAMQALHLLALEPISETTGIVIRMDSGPDAQRLMPSSIASRYSPARSVHTGFWMQTSLAASTTSTTAGFSRTFRWIAGCYPSG